MIARSASFFISGLLVGLLLATGGFAWFVRHQAASHARSGTSPMGLAPSSGERWVLKLGHSLDQNHPVHAAMVFMAERLDEKSAGRVQLEIFPNSQLGSETECIEQLQRGVLAMTKTSAAPMESFIPEMAIFGVPYVFRDQRHYWAVLEGEIGTRLLGAGEPVGLHGLCYYDAGSRNFYTIDRPILTPDDLRGVKIRVQKSETAMEMVRALGGSPTPIPWGELYTGLQQKLVDGAENNPPSFYTNRHYEVCKHLTMDEHTLVPDLLLISHKVWSRLPPQVQQWVQESADESSRYQRQLWQEKTDQAIGVVQEYGVTVHYPDKGPFIERVGAMHDRYTGTPIGSLLQEIDAVSIASEDASPGVP